MSPSATAPAFRQSVVRPSSPSPGHELITYIFPDFNAVRYFQREFEAVNEFHSIEYSKTSGFDIYLVEQWINNRNIGSLISTYTGNASSEVMVVKFTTVKKPSKYYPLKFQEYLNELMMNHAKIKQMNKLEKLNDKDLASDYTAYEDDVIAKNKLQGDDDEDDDDEDDEDDDDDDDDDEYRHNNNNYNRLKKHKSYLSNIFDQPIDEFLFITNITSLPSHLSLIPVVSGDSTSVEHDFIINSNLKKLQCGGRSISLITPKVSDASEDKFRQMYKIYNLNIPIKFAIKELINIIQISLFYFDLLDAKYCDGLLCSKTEDAIVDWWNLIGLPHFNVKPNVKNGILPSRTVSAIISLILSVKIRLQLFGGCDVPKDPFDFENFMISIGEFQKQTKLEKRRKLDLETLNKLIYITNNKLNPNKNKFSNESINKQTDHLNDSPTEDNLKTLGLGINSNELNSNNDTNDGNTTNGGINNNLYPSNSPINSPFKKNKNYAKEFKKLTSAVKSSVQERINTVNKPANEAIFESPSNRPTTRLRDRLAKLGDNTNFYDVETMDLELLVRQHLVGKTLIRLWFGVGNIQSDSVKGNERVNGTQRDGTEAQHKHIHHSHPHNDSAHSHSQQHHHHHHHNHNHHHHHHHRHNNHSQFPLSQLLHPPHLSQGHSSSTGSPRNFTSESSKAYKFVSFKDAISNTQKLTFNDTSRYSRGLNRMKLGLQKNLLSNQQKKIYDGNHNMMNQRSIQNLNPNLSNGLSIVDALLKIPSDYDDTAKRGDNCQAASPKTFNNDNIVDKENRIVIKKFHDSLNRRNSFPCFVPNGETSLNVLEITQEYNTVSPRLKRSNSFSLVENNFGEFRNYNVCMERWAQLYLTNMDKLIRFDNIKKRLNYENEEGINNSVLKKQYKDLNYDLDQLRYPRQKLDQNKQKLFAEDMPAVIDLNVQNLSTNVDRLVYESRIIQKRINELEQNCRMLQNRLKVQKLEKLAVIINNLIFLNRFHKVFEDDGERNDIILRLTGDNSEILKIINNDPNKQKDNHGPLRMIAIFFWEMMMFLFQLFKFDRSKMNLDRIRETWGKLDPNRKYINKAYDFVGHDSSRASIGSRSSIHSLDKLVGVDSETEDHQGNKHTDIDHNEELTDKEQY